MAPILSWKKLFLVFGGMSRAFIYSFGFQWANETLLVFIHILKGLAAVKNESTSLKGRLPVQFPIWNPGFWSMLQAQMCGALNLPLPLRIFSIMHAMGDGEKEGEGWPRRDRDLGW